MRLLVDHRTTYRFDPPMRGLVQSLRLTPSLCAGQQVIAWSVEVEGAECGAGFRDGAGDWIETAVLPGPVEEAAVSVRGEIATVNTGGVLTGHRERIPPESYLRPTRATRADRALEDLAAAAVEGVPSEDVLSRAHVLSAAVLAAIAYTPSATEPNTTAAEALSLGRGVCQDHTHALIAAALTLDIPARYVTGYLFTSDEDGGQEASHAWAELFVPDLGWVGFDAANGVCPDDRYIRLGSGGDAIEAAPIRGLAQGTGIETMVVAVDVTRVPDPVQSQTQQ